jgi:hypothetical protein
MNLRDISQKLETELSKLFERSRLGIPEREDSRAFGAMIEKRVKQNWKNICSQCGVEPIPIPGKRTIYDFGFKIEGRIVGIDAKTKDLDSKKYSDGGICSVRNLLKFLVTDQGQFIIAEFGHKLSAKGAKKRDLEYIRLAPFTVLPARAYRIENLGTGQLRLDCTISDVWNEVAWSRDIKEFYSLFTDLAMQHYRKVGQVAQQRLKKMQGFQQSGYAQFKLK